MKNKILLILLLNSFYLLIAQHGNTPPVPVCSQYTIVPLRTYTDIPEDACYYVKDTQNELQYYEGTWVGIWNNRTIYLTFKKISNKYNEILKYNEDVLIGKFKVIDANNNVLFDNTSINDNDAKIEGSGFRGSYPHKFLMSYLDTDLCNTWGFLTIEFANPARTQLEWFYDEGSNVITDDCPYYNTNPFPYALPEHIILTKQ